MQTIINIQHAVTGERGRYAATLRQTEAPAELTYLVASPGLIVAEHTEVPIVARGQGVAQVLVERLVDDARHGGYRILPTCSYIRAQFHRHPQWADVLHG